MLLGGAGKDRLEGKGGRNILIGGDGRDQLISTSIGNILIGGITKMADLIHGLRSPSITPGPSCWYCPLRETCDGARKWEEERESLGVE